MKKWIRVILFYFSTIMLCQVVSAGAGESTGELDDRWYLAPSISYIGADSNRLADDDVGFQFGLGKALNEQWSIEISGVTDQLEVKNSPIDEFKQRGILFDAVYFFNRDPSFAPYAVFGVGGLRTEYQNRTETNPFANIGFGFFQQLTDNNFRLRGDVRYRLDDDEISIPSENRFNDWTVNLGIAIPLGAARAAAPPVDSDGDGVPDEKDQCRSTPPGAPVDMQGCELDSDGDGVKDSKDRCPQTAQGATVDEKGCLLVKDTDGDGVSDSADDCPSTPPGVAVDARGCKQDGDGDGVADRSDKCPDTVAGIVVGEEGCEVDSDRDGVVDSRDRCPNTVAGEKVDINGCVIPDVVVLKGVTFTFGKSQLTDESSTLLNDVAASLRKNPTMVVEVAGYTDDSGPRLFNEALSQKRANSVVQYLIENGVASGNLKAKGYGPANPLADNTTAEGRKKNRRVEMHILSR